MRRSDIANRSDNADERTSLQTDQTSKPPSKNNTSNASTIRNRHSRGYCVFVVVSVYSSLLTSNCVLYLTCLHEELNGENE